MIVLRAFFVVFLISISCDASLLEDEAWCKEILTDEFVSAINMYKDVKEQIYDYVLNGFFKGKTYNGLANFVDKFGGRPAGSRVLEKSIDYMLELTSEEGLNNVVTEKVVVPHWQRGEEKLTMLKPRIKNIAVLGLGGSVSTPLEGIVAEVVVVNSFDELSNLTDDTIRGKIVLFDQHFTVYSETAKYRSTGAVKAAAKGAIACLIRSVTSFSINSPHTGYQVYSDEIEHIPTAAISLEDADLMRRMYDRRENITVQLKLFSGFDTEISRNTIIDVKGQSTPEEQVIVSAHIDSWDVGQGAMDDGDGLFITWAVPVILNRLNLIPKRTVRTIFWTAEEVGYIGAHAYREKHKSELNNINFFMEADQSSFAPEGLRVTGSNATSCVIEKILSLFKDVNASTVVPLVDPSTDISLFAELDIPGAVYHNDNERYIWFHHSAGDTLNVLNSRDMDLGAAFWTTVAFIIADLKYDIPK